MTAKAKLGGFLKTSQNQPEELLSFFDELEPVNAQFMISRWKGSEIHTDHPLNGFLEASNWYGKEFVNDDQVHPLLFQDSQENIFKVKPYSLVMKSGVRFPILKHKALNSTVRFMTSLLKTEASQARLRMMEYRQKLSATMIYDSLPIHDTFRKVDDDTVLGLMDSKDIPIPFFFVLEREH
ncbi:DUF4334 domain-containing protein [Acaryochloris marina NIES-2412]|uniref:DUF4334 domain-containing protein n=1 Tax=Acaryochloris marina TaxID=155978 RepID=UPI0040590D0D